MRLLHFLTLLFVGFMILGQALPAFSQQADYLIEDRIEAAEHYMQSQKWDYASYEWRNVLAQDPRNIQAHRGLSQSLLEAGFPEDAVSHLQSALQQVPDLSLTLALANTYIRINKLQNAGQIYQDILTKTPYEPQAYKALNKLVSKLENPQKQTLQNLLADQAKTAREKAKSALQLGRYTDARPYLEIASTHYSTFGLFNDYGLSLFLTGKRDEAANLFGKMLGKSNPPCVVQANAGLVALSQGRADQARQYLESALGQCKSPAFKAKIYNNLGYVYENTKRWSKAQYAYQRALELDPALTKAGLNLGYIYQREKHLDKAVSLYQSLLNRDPGNAEAWNQLGFTYELRQEPKQALQAYQKAIAANPSLKDAYFNLGILYKKQNKIEEADMALKQISRIDFEALENTSPEQAKPKQPTLFQYIDVFFTETAL